MVVEEHQKKKQTIKNFRRSSDSFFTKIIARSISVHITPLLAKTSITPLQVTILGLFVGLFAAWIGANREWSYCIAAAFLMEFSHILDCIDGELARLTGRGNPFAACLDPICDRILDISVIYAGYLQSFHAGVFNLPEHHISIIAFFTISCWMFYQFIVEAYLNPAKQKKLIQNSAEEGYYVYLGLYDLFVYGSILFWICHIFEYFIFYILSISILGSFIQIIKLKKLLLVSTKK